MYLEPKKKKTPMQMATIRRTHMCWRGVRGCLRKGMITSWLMVMVALKIRESSVEIMASTMSRQKSPSRPPGSRWRSATGSIC